MGRSNQCYHTKSGKQASSGQAASSPTEQAASVGRGARFAADTD